MFSSSEEKKPRLKMERGKVRTITRCIWRRKIHEDAVTVELNRTMEILLTSINFQIRAPISA